LERVLEQTDSRFENNQGHSLADMGSLVGEGLGVVAVHILVLLEEDYNSSPCMLEHTLVNKGRGICVAEVLVHQLQLAEAHLLLKTKKKIIR